MQKSGKVPKTRGLRIFRPSEQSSDVVFRFSLGSLPNLSQLENVNQSEIHGRAENLYANKLGIKILLLLILPFLFVGLPISAHYSETNYKSGAICTVGHSVYSDLTFTLTESHIDVTCSSFRPFEGKSIL